ncbi:LLM class flavin-dependent oxidoreductase [Nocardia miyunensis]|uniref:LLM class flavin-dependent oxidoreductase n=1 Tax=Nocardia miyunensis TaxID=282684 RepID=UPI00082D8DDB|nr:LLM class flavin-dependent oxidoreductase [Nocardia miyunensis]
MSAISDEPEKLKFIHTYAVGLHTQEPDYDVYDPRWQQRQIDNFVEFAGLAEELGYDGLTVTEHHAPSMVCPSPNMLLAAAAVKTSSIRLGTAVTVVPLHRPIRAAEEAGTLDLLSNGRFELGIGRGTPREWAAQTGRDLPPDEGRRAWLEAAELIWLLLTERDVTYDGEFYSVDTPTTIATRPLQEPLPVWVGGTSDETMKMAARYGWNVMRNSGSNDQHAAAVKTYIAEGIAHGHSLSGANVMIERFVAIGETRAEIKERLDRFAGALGRFRGQYEKNGRKLSQTDGEVAMSKQDNALPELAIMGTPDEIIENLQGIIDETGTRRLLIECFSDEESRLFAQEVMPVLRERNSATTVAPTGVPA